MRVSLAQRCLPPHACGPQRDPPARPLLTAGGPRMILGCRSGDGAGAAGAPIEPRADTLFGPRAACLAARGGPLYVCDTGHHRLLIWNEMPAADHTPADLVIGQANFWREGRNAKSDIGPATLNVPTRVATSPGVLAVADAWNRPVLLWHGHPQRSNRPADVLLGPADFGGGLANRGRDHPDSGNRRVLVWHRVPVDNGACADVALAQRDFTTRDENAGEGAGPLGMRWPHGIAVLGQAVLVADAGNNRIMVWRSLPQANGMACDFVLGQAGMAELDRNRAAYDPTASTPNMPYGVTVQDDRLVVADTANSRVVGFDTQGLAIGFAATRLADQRDFTAKGDNRWCLPARDSLCWPYGVAACEDTLVVADSSNNRVPVWEAAP
jgi:DNA-binding beta-propeller fold protein YncE